MERSSTSALVITLVVFNIVTGCINTIGTFVSSLLPRSR